MYESTVKGGEKPMAKTSTKITCGCGVAYSSLEDAERHVDNTRHTVHVSLRIEPVVIEHGQQQQPKYRAPRPSAEEVQEAVAVQSRRK
jgi:hypothetical protein